jgi:hypothetical protein
MESRRRVVAALTVAAVALIVAAIAAVAVDSSISGGRPQDGQGTPTGSSFVVPGTPSSQVSLGTMPVLPTASPSGSGPSPTAPLPQGSHKLGFDLVGDAIVYYSADGTVVPVLPISGLKATLAGDRVTYTALKANRYGLRAGAYAGEFMPNVSMEQADGSSAQTGGVVLVSAVAGRFITDSLAVIAAPADRWVVALPVDIRGTVKPVAVTFDSFGLLGQTGVARVSVHFSGSLPVVNVIPDNAGYHVLVEQLGTAAWEAIDPTRLGLSTVILDPEHAMNELIVYGDGSTNLSRDVLVDRRVGIGRRMLVASGVVSVSRAVQGSRADLGPDRVLKISDVPVFVASS